MLKVQVPHCHTYKKIFERMHMMPCRLALSALANLQPDQAALVLNALANDPARLHSTGVSAPAGNATGGVALPEEFSGVEMSGVAGAIMVFEQVIKVCLLRRTLHPNCQHLLFWVLSPLDSCYGSCTLY